MKILNVELVSAQPVVLNAALVAQGFIVNRVNTGGDKNSLGCDQRASDNPEVWRRQMLGVDILVLQLDGKGDLSEQHVATAKAVLFAAFHAKVGKMIVLTGAQQGITNIALEAAVDDAGRIAVLAFLRLLNCEAVEISMRGSQSVADYLRVTLPALLFEIDGRVASGVNHPLSQEPKRNSVISIREQHQVALFSGASHQPLAA